MVSSYATLPLLKSRGDTDQSDSPQLFYKPIARGDSGEKELCNGRFGLGCSSGLLGDAQEDEEAVTFEMLRKIYEAKERENDYRRHRGYRAGRMSNKDRDAYQGKELPKWAMINSR